MEHSTGGVASTSHVIWTGDPPPNYTPYWPAPSRTAPLPNIFEQMGADPISKLAAAIERLAAALEGKAE